MRWVLKIPCPFDTVLKVRRFSFALFDDIEWKRLQFPDFISLAQNHFFEKYLIIIKHFHQVNAFGKTRNINLPIEFLKNIFIRLLKYHLAVNIQKSDFQLFSHSPDCHIQDIIRWIGIDLNQGIRFILFVSGTCFYSYIL